MLRAGVAALLNAQAGIGYPLTSQQVINAINTKLATHNRARILGLASRLDGYNNLGCTLSETAPGSVQAARTGNKGFLSFLRTVWSALGARLDPASASVVLHQIQKVGQIHPVSPTPAERGETQNRATS